MANPQKENGYTAIANETMEALAGIRIPGEARQCLDVILRKTYGFNKSTDWISLSQFALITHLGKSHICKNLNKLASMNIIITQKGKDKGTLYRFNKDYSTWKPLPKKVIITQKGKGVTQKGNKSLPNRGHTKVDITKVDIQKQLAPSNDSANPINQVIDIFYNSINPAINYANKSSRDAAKWLVDKYGLEKTLRTAEYAVTLHGVLYAPQITTPGQLKDKLATLKGYYEQHKTKASKQSKVIDMSNL